MAKLLAGKPLAEAITGELAQKTAALKERGVIPTLAVIRLGDEPGDLAYEKGAASRAAACGVALHSFRLERTASAQELLELLDRLNADQGIHGVLLLRPLPEQLRRDEERICNRLAPQKDVDGMTHLSAAGVYAGRPLGFAPCTAQAVLELLHFYGIDCAGKRVAVIGRSLVIGRPVAMLLLAENATVTLCHSKTVDIAEICRTADIIVTAAGVLNSLGAEHVRPGQVVIDVAMNYDPEKITAKGRGGMAGDAAFAQVEPIVAAITPVPGGVGSVTSAVLMKHTVEAALAAAEKKGGCL